MRVVIWGAIDRDMKRLRVRVLPARGELPPRELARRAQVTALWWRPAISSPVVLRRGTRHVKSEPIALATLGAGDSRRYWITACWLRQIKK